MVESVEYAQPELSTKARERKNKADRFENNYINHKKPPHAVIIIENMTVPADRRVWQQAQALAAEGWRVSVISPQLGAHRKAFEIINGVEIHRHPLPVEARSLSTYIIEYGCALFWETQCLLKIGLKSIDVVQICNPPDFLFAPALLAKKFGGAKVIFDHHDLTPELLVQKTGRDNSMLLRFARWAERMTFRTANQVISTNSVFRTHAMVTGNKPETDVHVVYSTPDVKQLPVGVETAEHKDGKEILLFWVGVIGSQDGVDILLDAMVRLRDLPGGGRFRLLIAGDGPERKSLEARSKALGLDDVVTFGGFIYGQQLANAFATADIGVGSDPKNSFNDRLAMNKIFEYMTYALPMVMFDLNESRKIADDAALYASNNDPAALAAAISNLIESPNLRQKMGNRGQERLQKEYSWDAQKKRYLDVYRSILSAA